MQLTDRSKQVSNKEMTLAEKIYLPAIATGMAITIKHFFQKKVTIRYPEVKRYLGPVFRGRHVLKRDAEGRERCTACGLCAVACPAEAIQIVAEERKKGEEHLYREEKYAAIYEVNMLRCIFCGLCEEACPKQAVYLRHDEFVPVFTERDQVIWGKDMLTENMNNRYLRKAWTREEAQEQNLIEARGDDAEFVPRAIP
ncbi:NADH-quinone oxidoreductase subunit I [Persicitalea sp.]|uniref:NuoI/complex I 23 kDa subunit family protein n=1 Tax=Persicitalea sp. TaxID=3100273 RepID=UPI0035948E06